MSVTLRTALPISIILITGMIDEIILLVRAQHRCHEAPWPILDPWGKKKKHRVLNYHRIYYEQDRMCKTTLVVYHYTKGDVVGWYVFLKDQVKCCGSIILGGSLWSISNESGIVVCNIYSDQTKKKKINLQLRLP